MMVTTWYPPQGVPLLLDLSQLPPQTHLERWLLLLQVLAFSICTQLFLLLMFMGFAVFQPGSLLRRQLYESQRRRYAHFIFRRLLWRLNEAFATATCCLDGNDEQQHQQLLLDSCLGASEKAGLAVQLFRRDAFKVLYPTQELLTMSAGELYFVADEEEQEMAEAGYGAADVKVEVSDELLMYLLYPERGVAAPTN
ncbi:hypothetical protein KR038_012170 [Drosophila bunnanda]|nr:hypothetical protein KR038_012170 [Drosophila bunnanda]